MLGRTCLVKHVTRHPLQPALTRPILRPQFPQQSRFYARPAVKGPHPLWLIGTVLVGFTSFFYLVKSRRGLGSPPYRQILRKIDPMNQDISEVAKAIDADKLPVLHKHRNPRFSKETVHVIFVLGRLGVKCS
jgi:hypothetical protein